MARYCLVAPPHILNSMNELAGGIRDGMGHSHLVLAHDIAANQKEYAKLFMQIDSVPLLRYIVLDNSVIELGTAVPLDIIKTAALIVKPTCIVLPDVLRDTDATIESCKRALDEWWVGLDMEYLKSTFLYIPQATNTFGDFVRCAEALADDPRIGFWGIPRNLIDAPDIGTRREAIEICNSLNRRRLIHMFGFSSNLVDDVICARSPYVYSIDSAVPCRVSEPLSLLSNPGPRGDWWEKGEFSPVNLANVIQARRWFQYKT